MSRARLTREQRKALWRPTEANAGAGWEPPWPKVEQDPREFEQRGEWPRVMLWDAVE